MPKFLNRVVTGLEFRRCWYTTVKAQPILGILVRPYFWYTLDFKTNTVFKKSAVISFSLKIS